MATQQTQGTHGCQEQTLSCEVQSPLEKEIRSEVQLVLWDNLPPFFFLCVEAAVHFTVKAKRKKKEPVGIL